MWENIKLNRKKQIKLRLSRDNKEFRQRPILPGSHPPSIVGVTELNFRVRDGNGCDLCTIATGSLSLKVVPSKLNNANYLLIYIF